MRYPFQDQLKFTNTQTNSGRIAVNRGGRAGPTPSRHETLVTGFSGSDDSDAGAFDIVAKLLVILTLVATRL